MERCARRFGLPRPTKNKWVELISPALTWSYRLMSRYDAVMDGVRFFWDSQEMASHLALGVALLSRVDPVAWRRCRRFFRFVFVVHANDVRYVREINSVVVGASFVTEPLAVAVVLGMVGVQAWHFSVGGLDRTPHSNLVSERLVSGFSLRFVCRCLGAGAVTRASYERAMLWLRNSQPSPSS